MRILFSLALISLTCLTFAQKKGVKFENNLNWDSVRYKAKVEGKFIFLDVYATWCNSCKIMERTVFSSEMLGTLLNDKFISIKIQADTSKFDGSGTRKWYKDSHDIIAQNKISVYPTYLFLSAEGHLINRDFGYKNEIEFNQLLEETLDTNKQYYTLLSKYQKGDLDFKLMPYLAKKARYLNETTLRNSILAKYFNEYLNKLTDEDSLLTRSNLLFIANDASDILQSRDKIFHLIFRDINKADSVAGIKKFSNNLISFIIAKEEIYSNLWTNDKRPFSKHPDWKKMQQQIVKKYGVVYADSLISPARFNFYMAIGDWEAFTRYAEQAMRKYPPKMNGTRFNDAVGTGLAKSGPANDAWILNLNAWALFEHTDNRILLNKALSWSELSIKLADPKAIDSHQTYDTRANLLYKLGRIKEGILFENKAIEILKKSVETPEYKDIYIKGYQQTLLKMNSREKTWPELKQTSSKN